MNCLSKIALGLLAVGMASPVSAQTIETLDKKFPKSSYDSNWFYGSVKFNLLSYSTNKKQAELEWYETLFQRFLFSKKKYGTFALVVDLCAQDCQKPLIRKTVAVFTKNPKQEVKSDLFKDAVSFLSGVNEDISQKEIAEGEGSYINTGAPMLTRRRIVDITNDNVLTVRIGLLSLERNLVEGGVLSDILTIYNKANDNPLIKAGFTALPGAGTAIEVVNVANQLATKLLFDPNKLTTITQDNSMQFINADGYPKYQTFAMAVNGGPSDCKRKPIERKNCVMIAIEFTTERSITKNFDVSQGKFSNPIDADLVWSTGATALKVSSMNDFLGNTEKMKQFLAEVNAGPYAKGDLETFCRDIRDRLNSAFTHWDSKALYWAFIKRHWFKLVGNKEQLKQCVGDDNDRAELRKIGLEYAAIP